MIFTMTLDVPEAKKGEIVPEEMATMFKVLARYYREQRELGVLMKESAVHIRDGEPSLAIRIQSITVQGEL